MSEFDWDGGAISSYPGMILEPNNQLRPIWLGYGGEPTINISTEDQHCHCECEGTDVIIIRNKNV